MKPRTEIDMGKTVGFAELSVPQEVVERVAMRIVDDAQGGHFGKMAEPVRVTGCEFQGQEFDVWMIRLSPLHYDLTFCSTAWYDQPVIEDGQFVSTGISADLTPENFWQTVLNRLGR